MVSKTTTLRLAKVSDTEFIYRAGESARDKIVAYLTEAHRLHSIKVMHQPNAFRINVIVAGLSRPCFIEACVEAEDGMYRLSVRSPDSLCVAEDGENIFHDTRREDFDAASSWLLKQVKESLTEQI